MPAMAREGAVVVRHANKNLQLISERGERGRCSFLQENVNKYRGKNEDDLSKILFWIGLI